MFRYLIITRQSCRIICTLNSLDSLPCVVSHSCLSLSACSSLCCTLDKLSHFVILQWWWWRWWWWWWWGTRRFTNKCISWIYCVFSRSCFLFIAASSIWGKHWLLLSSSLVILNTRLSLWRASPIAETSSGNDFNTYVYWDIVLLRNLSWSWMDGGRKHNHTRHLINACWCRNSQIEFNLLLSLLQMVHDTHSSAVFLQFYFNWTQLLFSLILQTTSRRVRAHIQLHSKFTNHFI